MHVATLAGGLSTILFAVGALPMLVRAVRTRDLTSYSRGNLVLVNLGNVVHSVYVFSLPAGPLWVLHSFYVVTSALMLYWHLRHVPATTGDSTLRPFDGPTSAPDLGDLTRERQVVPHPDGGVCRVTD